MPALPRPALRARRLPWGAAGPSFVSLLVLAACGGGGGGGGGTSDAAGGAAGDAVAPETDLAPPADAGPEPVDALVIGSDATRPGGTCANPPDLIAGAESIGIGWRYTGSTRMGLAAMTGACGGNGREIALRFQAPEPGLYRFTTHTSDRMYQTFDSVLYLRSVCGDSGTETACDANADGVDAFVEASLEGGQVLYVIVDAFAPNTGGRFQLTATVVRPGDEGDPCDPEQGDQACQPGLACLGPTRDELRCAQVVAPTVGRAALTYSPEVHAVGVRVSGDDAGGDVSGLSLSLFDAEGAEIAAGAGLGPYPFTFGMLSQADGHYTGEVRVPLPPEAPPVARATLTVTDLAGLASTPLDVEAEAPATLAAGATCEATRTFEICAAPQVCDDGACADPAVACPAAFGARPLGVGETTDASLNARPDLAQGPCGGGGSDAAYVFTAPEAGLYAFEAWGDEPGDLPMLWARDLCGVEDAVADRGCVLPGVGGRARLSQSLAAGEPLALFVGSADARWFGAFHLRAWQPAPPTLVSGEVYLNPAAGILGLRAVGRDPDDDVRAVGVRLLDAEGVDLLWPDLPPGEARPLDLRLLASERPGGEPETVHVRAARRADLDAAVLDRVAQVELTLVDAAGGRSEPLRVAPRAPDAADAGDACDRDGAFAQCAPGLRCEIPQPPPDAPAPPASLPDPEGACRVVRSTCPLAFGEVVPLSDAQYAQPDGTWAYESDTTGAANLNAGSCGGDGAPEIVHSFEAPADGTYVFRTEIEADGLRNTVLYVRSLCGEPGLEAEAACNDDGLGAASEVQVALGAGEVVYVFVDGFGADANAGPYRLVAGAVP